MFLVKAPSVPVTIPFHSKGLQTKPIGLCRSQFQLLARGRGRTAFIEIRGSRTHNRPEQAKAEVAGVAEGWLGQNHWLIELQFQHETNAAVM